MNRRLTLALCAPAVLAALVTAPAQAQRKQLVFSIDYLVAYITKVMTLLPGDVIATGTPSGIGPLKAGDTVTIRIPGVGDLTNTVADDTHATTQGSKP